MLELSAYKLLLRFRINRKTGCYVWTGAKSSNGYGYLCTGLGKNKKKTHSVHRTTYIECFGEIPHGKLVLHKCDNPLCINPDHLFLGTEKDNMVDMTKKKRHRNQTKTHCKHGHELNKENTKTINKGGGIFWRLCRVCARIRDKKRYPKRKLTRHLKKLCQR